MTRQPPPDAGSLSDSSRFGRLRALGSLVLGRWTPSSISSKHFDRITTSIESDGPVQAISDARSAICEGERADHALHRGSRTRLRTLFISETLPYPPITGRTQRLYHLLMALADVSDVTLVCLLPGHDDDRRHLNSLGEVCREVHAVGRSDWGYARNRTLPRPLVWLRSVAEYCHPTEPAWLRWYESQVASRLVGELCRSRFDLIWVERLPSLRLLPSARSERIVVDLDDLEHRKLGHRLRSAPFHRLLPFHGLEYLKLRRLERGLARLPYELAVCSTLDRQILDGDARVWVIPNGINLPEPLPHVTASVQPAELSKPGAPVFLFVGTLGYVANVDAVQYFARRILPRIRRDVPGARFLIVGREPSPQVQRLHDGDTTSVVGSVPDVAPFLRQAAVVVVPLRFGGGTRIKILEALAHRVPVVSTSVGAEGLEVESGKHLLLADSPSAFAQCCLRLLADPALREHLTAQGFELVRAKYEWRAIQSLVKTIVVNAGPLPVVATTSSSA